jgi:hypothetical protein
MAHGLETVAGMVVLTALPLTRFTDIDQGAVAALVVIVVMVVEEQPTKALGLPLVLVVVVVAVETGVAAQPLAAVEGSDCSVKDQTVGLVNTLEHSAGLDLTEPVNSTAVVRALLQVLLLAVVERWLTKTT